LNLNSVKQYTTAEACNKAQANTIMAEMIIEINLHLSIPTLLRMNEVQMLLSKVTNHMAMRWYKALLIKEEGN
jgi:hypothetical protein